LYFDTLLVFCIFHFEISENLRPGWQLGCRAAISADVGVLRCLFSIFNVRRSDFDCTLIAVPPKAYLEVLAET
jgi:hypothetical protein